MLTFKIRAQQRQRPKILPPTTGFQSSASPANKLNGI